MKPEDVYTLKKILTLHPLVRDDVLAAYRVLLYMDIQIRICQALRTFEEQTELYAKGRTKPGGIVTNAKAGESYHNYGLAFDFCLLLEDKEVSWNRDLDLNSDGAKDWSQVVDVFKAAGFSSGGDWKGWKDYPHLEKSFGKSCNELLALHTSGDTENGYVRIKVA